MRGNREGGKFTDHIKSLLRSFVGVGDMCIKSEFIVYGESKVFEVSDLFHSLVVDGGGGQPG